VDRARGRQDLRHRQGPDRRAGRPREPDGRRRALCAPRPQPGPGERGLKRLLRDEKVQAFLGWVLAGYLKLMLRTLRWRHENVEAVEPVLAGRSGAVALFWHGRIPLCLATAPQWWRKNTRALISPSADGEFI